MKTNILISQKSKQKPGYQNEHIQSFLISENVYDEIFISYLSELEYNVVNKFLLDVLQKLNSGGKLTIYDLDITLASYRISIGNISIEDTNKLLRDKKSFHSLFSLLDFLEQTKMCICSKKIIEGNDFILEVTKI